MQLIFSFFFHLGIDTRQGACMILLRIQEMFS